MSDDDKGPKKGGSYIIKDGKKHLFERKGEDHKDGNCARDKDGNPLFGPKAKKAKATKPAAATETTGDKS